MPRSREITPFEAFAISDVGLVRKRNEDAAWVSGEFVRSSEASRVFERDEAVNGVVLAVADGVGGANAGDEASEFVVNAFGESLLNLPIDADFAELSGEVQDMASSVNRELQSLGQRQPGRSGMSTTYTGLVVRESVSLWANAGDSRLYGFRDGSLTQTTRDHTLREMTGDETIPGNIIVNCFGTETDFYCDVGALDFAEDTIYLLCSDGLSDYVDHAEMERIVAGAIDGSLGDAGRRLVAAAKDGGGGDNITLLMCRRVGA